MLLFLDILLTIVHLFIIGFNLTGWIFPRTRKLHLVFIALTALSWFVLGIWFGMGYCPVTDWQWQVKELRGERGLPSSFITYFVNKITGEELKDEFVNNVTLVVFIACVLLSLYVNFWRKKGQVPVK